MANFGKVLRSLRKGKHMSQTELSKKLELSFSTISMYERGEREPDFETLEAIADYFNVTMDYLLGVNKRRYSPLENTVHITRRTGSQKSYTLSDRQTDVIEGMLEQMPKAPSTSPYGEIAAEGGELNHRKKKPETTL